MRHLRYVLTIALASVCVCLSAQVDRHDVRSGNRRFRKGDFKESEINYRKALVKDSTSFAANYDLASALYRQKNYDEAGKSLDRLKQAAPMSVNAADYYYNVGNVALQKKDYQGAVDAYKQSLYRNPGDLEAKENYIYAKLMLKNKKNGGGGDNNKDQNKQNQDQNKQDQNKQDQDQNQNKQNQDQNKQDQDKQNQNAQQQPQQGKISPQQAQQMLQAVQAKEKDTQDKVKKEKAELLKSKQKDKNW
ncbi:MAG: tetratricopeptide repeat protein [Bacteroidales bacterium]